MLFQVSHVDRKLDGMSQMLKMVLSRQDEILQGQQQQHLRQLPQNQLSPNQLPPPSPKHLTVESHPQSDPTNQRKLSSDSTNQGSSCGGSANIKVDG